MKNATAITITINIKNTLSIILQSSTGQIQLLNRTKLLSSEVISTPFSELLYVKGNSTLLHAH